MGQTIQVDVQRGCFRLSGSAELGGYGFRAIKLYKEYEAPLAPDTLLQMAKGGYILKYSNGAAAFRDVFRDDMKRMTRLGRYYKTVEDFWVDGEFDDLGIQEKLPLSTYQKRAILFALAIKRPLLNIDMGLGKSCIGATFAQYVCDTGHVKPGKILLIAPDSLLDKGDNWDAEFRKFSDLLPANLKDKGGLDQDADVYMINPESFWRWCDKKGSFDPKCALVKHGFELIIYDEFSTLASHDSKITTYFQKFISEVDPKYILGMTGLPAPNRIFQLWGQVTPLGFWLGGNFNAFQSKYGNEIEGSARKFWVCKKGAEEEIRNRIEPITLSMSSEDHFKLPPYEIKEVLVPMPEELSKLYLSIENDYFATLNLRNSKIAEERQLYIEYEMAARTKLLQALAGFVSVQDERKNVELIHLTDHPKADSIVFQADRILSEDTANNIIIWTRYREEMWMLKRRLSERWLCAHGCGGMSKREKNEQRELWLGSQDCRIRIVHPGAFKFGHTWLKANHTFYASAVDDNNQYAQSRKRNHRRGQTRPITEWRFLMEKTLESKIWQAILYKQRLDAFLKGGR